MSRDGCLLFMRCYVLVFMISCFFVFANFLSEQLLKQVFKFVDLRNLHKFRLRLASLHG